MTSCTIWGKTEAELYGSRSNGRPGGTGSAAGDADGASGAGSAAGGALTTGGSGGTAMTQAGAATAGGAGCASLAWVWDADADGHGSSAVATVMACSVPRTCPAEKNNCGAPEHWVVGLPRDDCDDADPSSFPGAWDGPAYEPRTSGLLQPGLRADFESGGETFSRTDRALLFDWVSGPPDPAFLHNDFGATWTGTLQARSRGSYEFCAYGDDVLDVFLNGQLVVKDENFPGVTCAMFPLEEGVRYAFRATLGDSSGNAIAKVWWRGPGFDAQHVLDTLPLGAETRPERCDGKKQNCSASKADADAIDDSDGKCDCSLACKSPY